MANDSATNEIGFGELGARIRHQGLYWEVNLSSVDTLLEPLETFHLKQTFQLRNINLKQVLRPGMSDRLRPADLVGLSYGVACYRICENSYRRCFAPLCAG